MAGQVNVCSAAPPCFSLDGAAPRAVLDARLFPAAPPAPPPPRAAPDLDELAVCRKVGDPDVIMTVELRDGTRRPMLPAERETLYCNRWFQRLVRRCRRVPRVAAWDCCELCLNCDRRVYLAGPHLRAHADAPLSSASACGHIVCLRCLLKNSFRRRGFGHAPQCPFCNAAFDEDDLVPLLLSDGD